MIEKFRNVHSRIILKKCCIGIPHDSDTLPYDSDTLPYDSDTLPHDSDTLPYDSDIPIGSTDSSNYTIVCYDCHLIFLSDQMIINHFNVTISTKWTNLRKY